MARAIELEIKSFLAQLLPTTHQASQSRMATPRCAGNCFLNNFNSMLTDPLLCTTSHFTDGSTGGGRRPDPPTRAHNSPPPTKRGDRYRDRHFYQRTSNPIFWREYITGRIDDHISKRGMRADREESLNTVEFYGALKGKLRPTKIFACFLQLREI